jgi:hypothetical protein
MAELDQQVNKDPHEFVQKYDAEEIVSEKAISFY